MTICSKHVYIYIYKSNTMPFVGSTIFGVRVNCWLKFIILVAIGLGVPLGVLWFLSLFGVFNVYTIIATYAISLLVSMLVADAFPQILGKPTFQSKNKTKESEREVRFKKIIAIVDKD